MGILCTVSEQGGTGPPNVTIEALPDDVLVEIFDFYVNAAEHTEEWHTLVHVCRRWRCVVYASQHRLRLRLLYTGRRPVRNKLDVWPPALPIIVRQCEPLYLLIKYAEGIITALEHRDRICEIALQGVPSLVLERYVAVMQEPFPALTSLHIESISESAPGLPDSFLGGSAPRLRSLHLEGTPYPALGKLLSSASDLVHLHLWNMPNDEYTSPEAMVAVLSMMSRLKTLRIAFPIYQSYPDGTSPRSFPPTRNVLPALTSVLFRGAHEYAEDLVARIDTPLLDELRMLFFNQLIYDSDRSQLFLFLGRTGKFRALGEAVIVFSSRSTLVKLSSRTGAPNHEVLTLGIQCIQPERQQLSSFVRLCSSSLPALSNLDCLTVREDEVVGWGQWRAHTESDRWLELLSQFGAVKNLYLSEELGRCIAPALRWLSEERVTDVLPALQNIFLGGLPPPALVEKAIAQFVAARQLSDRPLTVTHWERDH
jgi:hypothetical protein